MGLGDDGHDYGGEYGGDVDRKRDACCEHEDGEK